MSLFQCENCGCVENTALSCQGFKMMEKLFDWTGKENLRGKKICSMCGPTKYRDGKATEYGGEWHGYFELDYLPKGMFYTNDRGNLAHKETHRETWKEYKLPKEEGTY